MGRRLDDVATVVAALSRAAGPSLDAPSILARTVAVLEDEIELSQVSLWRTTAAGMELLATHPAAERELTTLDLDAEAAAPGALSLPLAGRTHELGRLVARPAEGTSFAPTDEALLDIAASAVAGSLERAQLFAEVMELERLKSDFIARVSHELRTPITIINGFLETLIAHDEHLDSEQRVHMLERSRAASARLSDLIEELLILSRIEGGMVIPQLQALLVADLFEAVRAAAAEPDQVLITGLVGQPVTTDANLLNRALSIVVDNAVKYGGVAELLARREGDRCIVEVRDRGPGFPDDIRDTAFEMFTRSQTNTSVPGLGVGLAIARTLIEVLDGSISIDTAHAGPGALVRVSLPA